MTKATIEDTEITLLWGDQKLFCQRVKEYGDKTAANYSLVIPLTHMKTKQE